MSKNTLKPKILYGENDAALLTQQAAMLERAGYAVEKAEGRRGVEQALPRERYDLVILGHTLTKSDRHHLPYMAKKANQETRVLVLHASGRHHAVDAAIDSRQGEQAVLQAVEELLAAVPA